MPAGASWPRYAAAVTGVLLSMFAGSQTVHIIYQPLKSLNDRVEIEKHRLRMAKADLASSSSTSSSSSNGDTATKESTDAR